MSQGSDSVRILIVADDPLARAGVAALLSTQAGVIVAGQTGADADLAAAVDAFAPDAVVWDLGWDSDVHVDALSRFCDEHDLPVVALLADPATASEVRAAGARGLLGRTAHGAQLAAAAAAGVHGLHVFGADLLPPPAHVSTSGEAAAPVEPLSSRELDVLRGLAEGLSNKQLGRALGISEHTVKFHINAIMGKLGAQSRTEAVVRATRAGLILL
jgi:DNA-binding NarL/FixJ family response regulator